MKISYKTKISYKMKITRIISILTLCLMITTMVAKAQQPVVSDSRVKTLVYNPNDVYSLLTHHGYQAHIEFSPKESIQTISLGDKTAWQIIANGRRIFIRPLVGGERTNMTVITNLRSYLFDIQSTKGKLPRREDLVYMVRFYYPDEHIARTAGLNDLPPIYPDQIIKSAAQPTSMPALNFDYTYTGNAGLAPEKVFDDGKATYFKLKPNAKIFVVNGSGKELPAKTSPTSDGFLKVDVLNSRFIVKYETGDSIQIFNEKMVEGAI
jgi:type IV secretion system protein VirB9